MMEEYKATRNLSEVTFFQDRPPRCDKPKVCNLWHKSGVRYMRTCQVTILQSGLSITIRGLHSNYIDQSEAFILALLTTHRPAPPSTRGLGGQGSQTAWWTDSSQPLIGLFCQKPTRTLPSANKREEMDHIETTTKIKLLSESKQSVLKSLKKEALDT